MITNSDMVHEIGLRAVFSDKGKTISLPILSSAEQGLVVRLKGICHIVCEWIPKDGKGCFYLGNGEVQWFEIWQETRDIK